MILSSLLSPFRIYSEYHELEKFRKDCQSFKRFELITDKTRLLPIQFRRDISPYPITHAWLRQECDNFYNPLLSNNEANFISAGNWLTQYCSVTGGYAVFSVGTNGYVSNNSLLTVGNKYRVKVVVSDINVDPSNSYSLTIKNGTGFGDPFQAISGAGVTIFEFTATNAAILIQSTLTGSDTIKVKEFSVWEISDWMDETNDYELDPTMFEIVSTSDKDIITYCGQAFDKTLPCGDYYLILKSKDTAGDEVYYFSEVISIKNFVPSQSPYVFIEWYNSCDIQNVKFTNLDCNYKHRLYIDGTISKPEYPFKDDVETDGDQNEIPTFQKWEKIQILSVPKATEFVTDSLTAMALHDTIKFYYPIKHNQFEIDFTNDANDVLSVKHDVNYILNDCAANLELKLLLDNRMIDSTCCTEIALVDNCVTCTYQLEGICVDSEEAKICPKDGGLPGYNFYLWNGSSWVLSDPPTGTLLCFPEEPSLYFNGSEWVNVPTLSAFTNQTSTITITGDIYLFTVCQIILTRGTYVYTVPGYYSQAQLAMGIVLNKADLPAILFSGGDLQVTIHNVQGGCDYGYSNSLSLCYGDGC